MMKHIKYITGSFLILALVVIIYSHPSEPVVIQETSIMVPAPQEIYIANHGWHTGFIIPTKTIYSSLPQLQQRFGNVPYIEIGWGDQGFYQANDITIGLTLNALFLYTESVIHAVAVPIHPEKYFYASQVEKLCLDKHQYALLLSFLENSFAKGPGEKIEKLGSGIYGNSQFYKGKGYYYLANTCNKWTAKGLRSAKLDISPAFKITSESIMTFLSQNSKYSPATACKVNSN